MTTKASERFPRDLQLWQGSDTKVIERVTNDDQNAGWIVLMGTTGITQALPSGTLNEFFNSMKVLDHVANGDFDSWTAKEHFPNYPIQLPAEFGTLGKESLTRNTEKLYLGNDGLWYEKTSYGKGKLAVDNKQVYHSMVNWIIGGDTVILSVPGFYQKEWIRNAVSNLSLGVGKVNTAVQEAIEEGREEKAEYLANRPFVESGRGEEVGVKPVERVPQLLVTSIDGSHIDLLTEKVGKVFGLYTGKDHKPFRNMAWNPDDTDAVKSWTTIAGQKYITVGPKLTKESR